MTWLRSSPILFHPKWCSSFSWLMKQQQPPWLNALWSGKRRTSSGTGTTDGLRRSHPTRELSNHRLGQASADSPDERPRRNRLRLCLLHCHVWREGTAEYRPKPNPDTALPDAAYG